MKKLLFLFIALFLITPFCAKAFSYVDIFTFGRKILKREMAARSQAAAKAEKITAAAKISAQEKSDNWRKAYEQKNFSALFSNEQNFYFSEEEINYLLNDGLAKMEYPPVKDLAVDLQEGGVIKIFGQAQMKMMSGAFFLEARFISGSGRIFLKTEKAVFRGLYFPALIADNLFRQELKETIDFLYSDKERQNLNIEVGEGYLKLNYFK